MSTSNTIGPVGGPGSAWNNLPTVARFGAMSALVVRHGEIIDAIQPFYGALAAPSQGGQGGSASRTQFAGEPIVQMFGYTGNYYGAEQVVQLGFKTLHGKTIGPFGTMGGVTNKKSFELAAPAGQHINSFFGATVVHTGGGTYIASLGGNTAPLESLAGTQGPVGGATTSTFNDWPTAQYMGSIINLTVWHGEVVDAIQASYNGATLEKHGGGGGAPTVAAFSPSDPLVEISGHYGPYYGATQILQITLKSRSGHVYGPFGGTAGGTAFSLKGDASLQIGALSGGSYRHTDGSEFLSSLGASLVRL